MNAIAQTLSKYLYAIIPCPEPRNFTSPGIGGEECVVHTVNSGRLAAVVSDSPVIEYDNSRRNMMAHTRVLEEVMRDFVLLPVRFSTVAPTLEAVTDRLLSRRQDEFSHLLEQVRGRVELGLKAFWREGVVFAEIIDENPGLRALRDAIQGRPADKTHFERIRLGQEIEQVLSKKRIADEQRILDRLKPLVHKTRCNKLIGDRMVLNAAFLVDHAHEVDLDRAVRDLDAEFGSRFLFKYVGPVAPYNFVNIVVNWTE